MVSPDRDQPGEPTGPDRPGNPSEPGPTHGSPSKTAPPASAPLRLHADTGVCAGAGQCVRAAPDLFDQGDDGLVVLLRADVPEQARELALTAADWCPSGAVSVHEAS
ncbi:ferredoxin [Nocardiopsis synnemataformans]|uniref:ferredoxin n=1 Tax=Nocardiopsis synnemataformans TaxID=61305 RepID=UPI003EBF3EC6